MNPESKPSPAASAGKTEPKTVFGWHATAPTDHFVQFYRTDDYLIECLASFISDGLWRNERTLVIATPEHRIALEARLRLKQVDVISSTVRSQYLALDARELLGRFMAGGTPDLGAFTRTIGGLIQDLTANGQKLRAFGEMVALLWMEGNPEAAIQLERFWNDLSQQHPFALFCAYPAQCSEPTAKGLSLEHICDAHSCVVTLTA